MAIKALEKSIVISYTQLNQEFLGKWTKITSDDNISLSFYVQIYYRRKYQGCKLD